MSEFSYKKTSANARDARQGVTAQREHVNGFSKTSKKFRIEWKRGDGAWVRWTTHYRSVEDARTAVRNLNRKYESFHWQFRVEGE